MFNREFHILSNKAFFINNNLKRLDDHGDHFTEAGLDMELDAVQAQLESLLSGITELRYQLKEVNING